MSGTPRQWFPDVWPVVLAVAGAAVAPEPKDGTGEREHRAPDAAPLAWPVVR